MNTNLNKKSGFTLLEVIIVIIIIGVLASLALPRFFATVEFSRSTEALNTFVPLRDSMERCFMSQSPNSYTGCTIGNLDFDPGNAPGAHFTYAIDDANPANGYTITATRNGVDDSTTDPAAGDTIDLAFDPTAATPVTRTGSGHYAGIH